MSSTVDLGIIRFDPSPNIADREQLTASVDALETYVSVDLGSGGLWVISIDGEFVSDEYPHPTTACMAALGHLIVHAVDVVTQAPGIPNMQRQEKLCRDWLNNLTDTLRSAGKLPDSIQHALNSGDGTYRP